MLEDAKEHFDIKRRECKSLNKEVKALIIPEHILGYGRLED